jgi:hypothetical protein
LIGGIRSWAMLSKHMSANSVKTAVLIPTKSPLIVSGF